MKWNELHNFNLNLSIILKCGQSFRWSHHPLTNEFSLGLNNRSIVLKQNLNESKLFYTSLPYRNEDVGDNRKFIEDYFRLDINLDELYHDWTKRDKHFQKVNANFKGVLILNQDPWECLISFICSSNNNISRITQMISKLSQTFSEPLNGVDGGYNNYPFPPPSKLSSEGVENTLRKLGFGYRAKYVHSVAKTLLQDHNNNDKDVYDYLFSLRSQPYDTVIPQLTSLMGVGPKVADCVALMSLNQNNSIPVDTHVWQIAIRDYGFLNSKYVKGLPGKKVTKSSAISPAIYGAVGKMFRDIWGDYAGWAHTVLFAADLKAFKDLNTIKKDESVKEEIKEEQDTEINDLKIPGGVTSILKSSSDIDSNNKENKRVIDDVDQTLNSSPSSKSNKKIKTEDQ